MIDREALQIREVTEVEVSNSLEAKVKEFKKGIQCQTSFKKKKVKRLEKFALDLPMTLKYL